MKIAFLDLNHISRGIHTNTVPLGLGFISTYLKNSLKGYELDVKIFKSHEKAYGCFREWVPDILGITQYSWNSELNLYFARLIKEINPSCLVVAGGPNLEIDSAKRSNFLKREGSVDICIAYDGEIPVAEIVTRFIKGESVNNIKGRPVNGSYSLNPENRELVESVENVPRLTSIDVFGSMYADGVFDDLLDDGFHPFLQTHRGCPFKCSFCHTSDTYYNKVLFMSPDIFLRDMDYLGKRFSGQHNVTLYMTNTNMSLFKEDFPIARIIGETQKKYDWPKLINVTSGKDPEKLDRLQSIINIQSNIALQTLTPRVLKNINRVNIPFEDFLRFQRRASRRSGSRTSTELILSLPGETKETFLEGLKTVINSGTQNIVIYTLMNLKGTPLSSMEHAQRNHHDIRHRVVPRQFSVINDTKILDTEEVIVGTKDMPFLDYIELRGLSFTVTTFFSSDELIPLRNFMIESGIKLSKWLFKVNDEMVNYPDLNKCRSEFITETKNELFKTREDLLKFYDDNENFDALGKGLLGDNLLRKYKCIVLSNYYKSYIDLAVCVAKKIIQKESEEKTAGEVLDDLKLYLLTRDLRKYFLNNRFCKDESIRLRYDIPEWVKEADETRPLLYYRGSYNYKVAIPNEKKERFDHIKKMNIDFDLSLQVLYRDGTVRDFWPVLVRQ